MISWEGRGTFRRIKKQNNFCVVMWERQDYLIPGFAAPLWNGVCRCSDTQGGLKQPPKIAKSYWISQHLQYSFFTYRFLLKTRVSLALGNSHLHFPRLHRKDLGDNWRASHPKSLPRPWFFREPGCIQGPAPEWQEISDEPKLYEDFKLQFAKVWFFSPNAFQKYYRLLPSPLHPRTLLEFDQSSITQDHQSESSVQNVHMLKKKCSNVTEGSQAFPMLPRVVMILNSIFKKSIFDWARS